MDHATEEGLPIVPDTSKDPLDGQADTNSPSVSSPTSVRLVHVSIPSVSSGQVDYIYLYIHSRTDLRLSTSRARRASGIRSLGSACTGMIC